jgi:hypothetical protein
MAEKRSPWPPNGIEVQRNFPTVNILDLLQMMERGEIHNLA